jgi:hypothetical protein
MVSNLSNQTWNTKPLIPSMDLKDIGNLMKDFNKERVAALKDSMKDLKVKETYDNMKNIK